MTSAEPWYAAPIPPSKLKVLKPLKLAFNNDGFFDWGDPDGDGPATLRTIVDRYAEAGSAFLSFGVGGETAWGYRSQVLDRFMSEVPDDELDELCIKVRDYQARFSELGTDPLTIVTERACQKGLTLLANYRVNRFHMDPRVAGSFFRQHPELVLPEDVNPGERRLNWAEPAVRDYHVAVYADLLEHYGVGGLDLEFTRATPLFKRDEPDKARHTNEFLRDLRKEADRIGAKRNKHLHIAIQFFNPETCKLARPHLEPDQFKQGLDPATWAKEGYVDILLLHIWSGRLRRPIDITPYSEMVEGTPCKLFAWVQPGGVRPGRDSRFRDYNVDVPTLLELAQQCAGLYIFNGSPATVAGLVK